MSKEYCKIYFLKEKDDVLPNCVHFCGPIDRAECGSRFSCKYQINLSETEFLLLENQQIIKKQNAEILRLLKEQKNNIK